MFRKRSLVYRCKSFHEKKKKNESHKTANRKTRTTASAEENVTYRVRNVFLSVAYYNAIVPWLKFFFWVPDKNFFSAVENVP